MRARDVALLSGVALGLQFSCRTAPPEENYRPAPVHGAGGRSVLASSGSSSGVGGGATSLGGEAGAFGFGGDGAGGFVPGPGSGGQAHSGTGGGSVGPSSGGAPSSLTCPQPAASSEPFSRAALRGAAAACAEWVHCRFEEKAVALAESVQEFRDSPDAMALAQADWREAMLTWAIADAMQFGPVASPSEAQGRDSYQGRGLREVIYAWKEVNRCPVEEQIVSRRYETLGFDSISFGARGLFGLEYLLFYQGADTVCRANSAAGELWATLSPSEIDDLKEQYAKALALDVHARSVQVKDIWPADGEDFAAQFAAAEGYPSEQEAMNVLGWALLYLEREVKDWKLGGPAGYVEGIPIETEFSGLQTELLRNNLEGFRLILEGCSPGYAGIGFDDWLIEAGHEELAIDLLAATRAAQATLDALPAFSLATQDQIEGAYVAVKTVTDLLKGDLFGAGSPLNLKLPSTVEGDTD